MKKDAEIVELGESMEQTIEMSNLSVVSDVGEVVLDSVMQDGLLKDIPILGVIAGSCKCIKNVSDIFFTKKLIVFLQGICDADIKERQEAIEKWETDSNYRIRIGESLIGMIHRCDDSLKAKWLSQLFYSLVLKRGMSAMFMRTEKVLSALSVMDVLSFLSLSCYEELKVAEAEPYANSGLYRLVPGDTEVENETIVLNESKMAISEAGNWIYKVLNNIVQ